MTISGRVTTAGRPVEGATVGVAELKIESRTTEDGRYSFIVPSERVRGQTVAVVARHRRYGAQSIQIALVGGSFEQNFVLGQALPVAGPPRVSAPIATPIADVPALASTSRTIDSSAFAESAGPLDMTSALAGRVPGLVVTSAAVPDGSSFMMFRGPRSISAPVQLLVVVDGIPLDNSSFASATQVFGLGGFDYGSPIQDIPLEDIATITVLNGPTAASLYGSRAANGVVLVTTKQGGGLRGVHVSATQRFTLERAIRLPSYQNQYGQGLGGQFEFFDGSGGGINDGVDQSWGPKLEGQPIIQASLTEPRRPDVRPWVPNPSGVRDYFGGARTIDANVAVDGTHRLGSFRMSLNARSAHGLTPGATGRRLGLTLNGIAQPTSRLSAQGNVLVAGTRAGDRPGTGYDEINPVSGFTRMGRQVDLAALRTRIRDTVEQINWIYTTRNNPFFQTAENSNDDHRGHIIGGGLVRYRVTDWLRAALRAGTDNYHESRNVQVAPGWKGGYPTVLGRGDFSGGGSQQQKVSAAERIANFSLNASSTRARGLFLDGTAGVETRTSTFQTTAVIRDSTAGGPSAVSTTLDRGRSSITSVYALGSLVRADYLRVNAALRLEQGSALPAAKSSAVFPSVSVVYDAAPKVAALRDNLRIGAARLRTSWWRAGNEITGRTLARTYVPGGSGAPALGVTLDTISGPEKTTGLELGAELMATNRRLGLDFTVYRERSSQLLVAAGTPAGDSAAQTGQITNKGFELQFRAAPLRNESGLNWDVSASFARNTNTVDKLAEGVNEVALGPSLWGASLVARVGRPLGVIVGTRYLRDAATQALVLRNGLPIADGSGALTVFGSWQPDWTTSVRSRMRYHDTELALLFDARMGGKIFSATNLWGSYAGTLSSTVAGRDSGMIVAGIDSVTGSTNSTKVTAEDYFHSLAAIHEAFIYDASYAKLREARLTYERPLTFLPGFRNETARLSLIGRNLFSWARAPNIDPETALSSGVFQGFEMGQLPSTRSLGFQLSITP